MGQLHYKTEKRNKSSSERLTIVITFAVCLLCWGTGYYYATGFPVKNINATFINKETVYIIGLAAILISGFAIQRLNDLEMLVRKRTRLPFMIFFLFVSTNIRLLPVNESIIIIVCLIVLLYELFKAYQIPGATVGFFNIGLSMGIASLIVPQMLFFVPLIWVGMYNFLALELKGFFSSLTGVLTVFWILLGWSVWMHDFSIYDKWFNDLIHINFFSIRSLFQLQGLSLLGILILLIIACIYVRMDSFSNNVRRRMMLLYLIYISVLSMSLMFLYGNKACIFQAIFAMPAAILVSYFFDLVKYRMKLVLYYLMLLLLLFSFIVNIWNF